MRYVGSIDQGTTSTRFVIFAEDGSFVASAQREHRQIYPRPGWVEHDAEEIWKNTESLIIEGLDKAGLEGGDLSAIGITNQRETIVPFSRKTGKPVYNAIVWQDLRGEEYIKELSSRLPESTVREHTGLLYSPYFSASKIRWILDNVPRVRTLAEKEEIVFGTMDSYLTARLTGCSAIVTDVTNASRYMLMDIKTGRWDERMLQETGLCMEMLPEIVPSSGTVYGYTDPEGPFGARVPVAGILGDQQAALFGQACFSRGESKCTYGTGCFLLMNIGETPCLSEHGLLTTVAYKEGERMYYALEGSVAVAGSLVQWARDQLKLVSTPQELDAAADSVPDNGGVYIVPAFSGLFAPYWRSDARGVIAGLTGYATRAHICRAILEATAFQANDIFSSMEADSGISIKELKVDGGMTNSMPLMAFQADIMRVPVIRPMIVETTSLGAAYAAGLTVGVWKNKEELKKQWKEQMRWMPTMDDKERANKVGFWNKAVRSTLGWMDSDKEC